MDHLDKFSKFTWKECIFNNFGADVTYVKFIDSVDKLFNIFVDFPITTNQLF